MHAKLLQLYQFFATLQPYGLQLNQAPLSTGFSRQEYQSGLLPCSSSGDLPDAGIESTSLTSPSLAEGVIYPQRQLGSPGLSCKKLEHQSQSCPALCNPMDYSWPGSCVHVILQSRKVKWVAIPSFSIFSHPGIKPWSPHCRQILYCLSHQGSPKLSYSTKLIYYCFIILKLIKSNKDQRILTHQIKILKISIMGVISNSLAHYTKILN